MGLIYTYLMTYGGAAVSLFRPFYGFLIYVSFSIIRPESLWFWSVPQGNYSRIIAIAFLSAWLIHGAGSWSLNKAKWPLISLICYVIWAAVSTMFCQFPDKGFTFISNALKIVVPAIAGTTLIKSRRDIYLLSWTITCSIGYVAYDFNLAYFDGFNRLEMAGFGGMDNNSMTIALVAGVGFAFFLGLSERTIWRRYLAFAAAALLTHAVFFSFSRGGMLGLAVVGMATTVMIPKTRKNVAFLCLGAGIALMMAGPQVKERFFSIKNTTALGTEENETERSAQSRIYLWQICGRMVAENPIVGKGPDHFVEYVQNYRVNWSVKSYFPKGKEAHTLWFQIAAELGIPGVTFLAAYYLLILKGLWPLAKRDKLDRAGLTEGAAARMVWTALAGFFVSAQFVSLEGLELPYYIGVVGMGVLKLQRIPVTKERQSVHQAKQNRALFDRVTESRLDPSIASHAKAQ